MDDETLAALNASIKNWNALLRDVRHDPLSAQPRACPLCTLFYSDTCEGCPVKEHTGYGDCCKTPFYAARQAISEYQERIGAAQGCRKERARAIAETKAEIAFLESLLPT